MIHIQTKGEVGTCETSLSPPVILLLSVPRRCFFCGSFVFVLSLPSVMCVYSSLVVTCWEIADFLVLFCVAFSCTFLTFPYGVLGKVWYLIVSIPDLCSLSYLKIGFILTWKVYRNHFAIFRVELFPFIEMCL